MKRVTAICAFGALLAAAVVLCGGLGATPQSQAQGAVSDCNGQSDGTPCSGDNGVTNLCILSGATCQNGLCSGARMSCPPPQQCAQNTGTCISPVRDRGLEREIERRR
jgi:hypothetical protein